MATEYRVVFAGAVLDGHEVEEVRQTAGKRLKVTPEQLVRLFSGKPVVLKKGLDMSAVEQYVAELNHIGMKVRVEPIPETRMPAQEPPPPSAPSSWPQLHGDESEKTQLADAEALQKYLGTSDPGSYPGASPDVPTYVVPRDEIVATRQRLEQALAAQNDLARAPTVIVSPKTGANHVTSAPGQSSHLSPYGHPISVVKEDTESLRKPVKHGENTLVADEGTLKAYFESTSGTGPAGLPEAPVSFPEPDARQPSFSLGQTPPHFPAESTPEFYPQPSLPPEIPVLPSLAPAPDVQQRRSATVPVTPTQAQRMLSSSIPQTEYELPPPRRGVGMALKILLGVVAVGIVGGAGLLVWIIIEATRS